MRCLLNAEGTALRLGRLVRGPPQGYRTTRARPVDEAAHAMYRQAFSYDLRVVIYPAYVPSVPDLWCGPRQLTH